MLGPTSSPLDRNLTHLQEVFGAVWRSSINSVRSDAIGAAIASAEALDRALPAEVGAAAVVASRDEVLKALKILVLSWPNASQHNDLSIYSAQLALAVREARPSIYALSEASKHLLRASRFLPSIAEVLEAIGAAEMKLTKARSALERLPGLLETLRPKLVEVTKQERLFNERWQRERDEEEAAFQRRLADGKSVDMVDHERRRHAGGSTPGGPAS